MNDILSKAITDYYKLKQKYENKIAIEKKKILENDSLTSKEKHKKFLQIKKTCINCKKSGGTIFSNNNNNISAVCGATNPCKLNIQINRGYYFNIRQEDFDLTNEIDDIKNSIILSKLKLLFNFNDEDTTLKEFETFKKDLTSITEYLLKIRNQYLSIVNNQDNINNIKSNNILLSIEKDKLKDLNKLYNDDNKIGYIKSMVEIYINNIIPIVEDIRKLKYQYSVIEENNDTNYLIQKPYTLNQLYIHKPGAEDGEGSIITNIQ